MHTQSSNKRYYVIRAEREHTVHTQSEPSQVALGRRAYGFRLKDRLDFDRCR